MNRLTSLIATVFLSVLILLAPPAIHAESFYRPSYGEQVGQKAARSFANLGTAWLEIPKNMINVSNQSNVFYGLTGGLFKGLVNTAGRLGVAVADLVSLPIPTQPIVYPVYVWQDFDADTVYGPAFRPAYVKPH
jgi:putative exosortase-associated protein (TIGR04073 family)